MATSPRIYFVFLLIALFPINARSFRAGGHASHSTSHVSHSTGHSHSSSVGHAGNTWSSYPNQAHSYPASTGLSGSGSQHQQVHSYPASTGHSGHSGYPNNVHSQTNIHRTEVHNHYHYTAPQSVTYGSVHYPVYHAQPPVYVYEYRNSGSRFDTLLAGLALYNLGKMSARHNSYTEYTPRSGEICLFEIRRNDGSFEKTRIDCRLISSFIWEAERVPVDSQHASNSVHTVVSTNTATVNGTTVSTTVVDALQVKGPSIELTPEMSCFIVRMLGGYTQLRQRVECHLLQRYSHTSFRNNAVRIICSNSLSAVVFLSVITCLF